MREVNVERRRFLFRSELLPGILRCIGIRRGIHEAGAEGNHAYRWSAAGSQYQPKTGKGHRGCRSDEHAPDVQTASSAISSTVDSKIRPGTASEWPRLD